MQSVTVGTAEDVGPLLNSTVTVTGLGFVNGKSRMKHQPVAPSFIKSGSDQST